MKRLLLICLFPLCNFITFGQTLAQNINNRLLQKDQLDKVFNLSLTEFDFSPLFMHTANSDIYGFIGDNYQRIRIKFISITKNLSAPGEYNVYGKSMVKSNICDFKGTITISSIKKYKAMSYGVDDTYKNKGIKGQYVIIGNYLFNENETQAHSGVFKGSFQSNFYLDKNNKVRYDDIDLNADGYANNQFIGQWASYKNNIVKKCNWGDFRIPNPGDLDIGAGEFSPNEKYLKYGWQNIHDIVIQNPKNEKAEQIETAKWWQ